MCGICGYANRQDDIADMLAKLRLRGPDDAGFYKTDRYCIGSTRLAIEDAEHGRQPMSFGDIHGVYNGEIYGYSKHGLKTQCDTEYILRSFSYEGEAAFGKWNGQFAVAMCDGEYLYLVRDIFGIKPLYYQIEGGLKFGSEVTLFSGDLNKEAVHLYFCYGYVPSPYTIVEGVFALEPGHFLKYNLRTGKYTISAYSNESIPTTDIDSVVRQTVSTQSRCGLMFSGGVDSTTIALSLKTQGLDLPCYVVRYRNYRKWTEYFDEFEYAKAIADHLKLDLRVIDFDYRDIRDAREEISTYLDQPFFDTSCFSVSHVLKAAKADGVKVLITGDGGDELFGGYYPFDQLGKPIANYFASFLSMFSWNHELHPIGDLIGAQFVVDPFDTKFSFIRDCDDYTRSPTHEAVSRVYTNNFLKNDILVKVDRMAAMNSMETRHPFLQSSFLKGVEALAQNQRFDHPKQFLKNYLRRYLPNNLIDRRKWGFSFPALSYLYYGLIGQIDRFLNKEYIERQGIFNYHAVHKVTDAFVSKPDWASAFHVWALLMFQWWFEKHRARWGPDWCRNNSSGKAGIKLVGEEIAFS